MSLTTRILFGLAAIAAAALPLRAGDHVLGVLAPITPLDPLDIFTRPGVQELSGRIIAKPTAQARATAEARLAKHLISRVRSTGELICQVPDGADDATFIRQLRATGEYDYVTPDWLCYPASDDPLYPTQWQHLAVQSSGAWATTMGSSDVLVGIVDAGIDLNHEDLAANIALPGLNSVGRPADAPAGGNVFDISSQSHGTRCAGIVAAIASNQRGGVGIAPGVRVLPVRCSNSASGSAFLSDILNGAEWAARNGATVVSVSYNGVTSPAVSTRGTVLKSLGTLLVYAAGNSNAELSAAADWSDVIIVGACDRSDQRYDQSNYGIPIDITAPGVDILTTITLNRYATSTGTSFAAPQVAAVAALVWSLTPAVSPDDVQNAILQSAIDIGDPGKDLSFGYGRLNAMRALQFINGTAVFWASPVVPHNPISGLSLRLYESTEDDQWLTTDSLPLQMRTWAPHINYPEGLPNLPASAARQVLVYDGMYIAETSSRYTFAVETTGSVRVYVDGWLLVNRESSNAMTSNSCAYLLSGPHTIRVEYQPDDLATAIVVSAAPDGLTLAPIATALFQRDPGAVDVCDIAQGNGAPGPDGRVDGGDFDSFFNCYFATGPEMYNADIANGMGEPYRDGQVDGGDFDCFFNYYFL